MKSDWISISCQCLSLKPKQNLFWWNKVKRWASFIFQLGTKASTTLRPKIVFLPKENSGCILIICIFFLLFLTSKFSFQFKTSYVQSNPKRATKRILNHFWHSLYKLLFFFPFISIFNTRKDKIRKLCFGKKQEVVLI